VSTPVLGAVEAALGTRVSAARPVGGGCINAALRVELADGRTVFLKHAGGDRAAAMYRAEARGLEWLGAGPLRVPAVVALGDGEQPFLALEWVEAGRPGPGHDEALGRGLAGLHAIGAPSFGLDHDNWVGAVEQPNDPLPDWPGFYLERRLEPFLRRAVDLGYMAPRAVCLLERLAARIHELCGPPEPPARLHGDLWGGNAMSGPEGEPVLIDPAVYGGHREVDLAMMRLFGGFSERAFAAYAEAAPLAAGHGERLELYQLMPLLVHAILFNGHYGAAAERVLARYAG